MYMYIIYHISDIMLPPSLGPAGVSRVLGHGGAQTGVPSARAMALSKGHPGGPGGPGASWMQWPC
jgi:hypothetical protein